MKARPARCSSFDARRLRRHPRATLERAKRPRVDRRTRDRLSVLFSADEYVTAHTACSRGPGTASNPCETAVFRQLTRPAVTAYALRFDPSVAPSAPPVTPSSESGRPWPNSQHRSSATTKSSNGRSRACSAPAACPSASSRAVSDGRARSVRRRHPRRRVVGHGHDRAAARRPRRHRRSSRSPRPPSRT